MRPALLPTLLAAFLSASPALAAASEHVRTVTVAFDDLDVGTPAGAAKFDRRIRNAAEEVCGPRPSTPRLLRQTRAFRTCSVRAIAEARRQVPDDRFGGARLGRRHGD